VPDTTTVRGKLLGSLSTERTPGEAILMNVDICEVKVMAFATGGPLRDEAVSVTVVHRPAVPAAAPLAQYVNKSELVPGFGV
jgi:hypothetical protein